MAKEGTPLVVTGQGKLRREYPAPPLLKTTVDDAYHAGRDAGRNGANIDNAHFRFFARPELTEAWQRGKAVADIEATDG